LMTDVDHGCVISENEPRRIPGRPTGDTVDECELIPCLIVQVAPFFVVFFAVKSCLGRKSFGIINLLY